MGHEAITIDPVSSLLVAELLPPHHAALGCVGLQPENSVPPSKAPYLAVLQIDEVDDPLALFSGSGH